MDIPGLISAVCAVLSIIGASFAWWQANLSKKAKQRAEVSEDRAERTLKAFEAMADSMKKPAISALRNGNTVTLINESDVPFRNIRLVNRGEFVRVDFEDGITLAPGQSVKVFVMGAFGAPLPGILSLQADDQPLYGITIPPGVE